MFLTRVGKVMAASDGPVGDWMDDPRKKAKPTMGSIQVGNNVYQVAYGYSEEAKRPVALFTPTIPVQTLKSGSSGPLVLALQKILNQLMAGSIPENGKFEGPTRKKVEQYQAWYGETADGVVGPKTWSLLTWGTATMSGSPPPSPSKTKTPAPKPSKVPAKKAVPTVVWVVGGLTAVAIIGGVAYALTRR